MTDWTSIADVAREFGLQEYATDAPALRDGLKRLMSSVHPDKNGGSFKSDQDKALFMRTKAALDYIELQSESGLALIPLSQLPAIVSAVSQALSIRPAMDSQTLQSNYMADARARISRRFVLPKISSGVFAAITGFLVAFPDKFQKNPIVGPILGERITQLMLLSMVVYSGLFFVMAWYRERDAEARAEYLMSERALGDLFEMVMHHAGSGEPSRRVSSRQILKGVQNLAGNRAHSLPFPMTVLGSRVDLQTLEKVASIQTQRLVERKLLTRVDVASLDTWYDLQGGSSNNA
jgi:hypothetical protein